MPGEIRLSEDVAENLVEEYGERAVEEYRELMPDDTSEVDSFTHYSNTEEVLNQMHPDNLSVGVEGIRDVEEAVEQYRKSALRYVLESGVEHRDVVLK